MPPTNPTNPIILQIQLQLDDISNTIIPQLEDALQQVAGDFIKQINEQLRNELELPEGPNNATTQKQEKEDQEKLQKTLGMVQGATDKIADTGVSLVQSVFGLVEQIYERIKAASPLLDAVERLFNLVWTLFFMPLGNKIGEILIPAVIQMMDDVMEIWDAFDGMNIGDMLAYAIEHGVILLSDFLISIGETLSDQSGLVGSIGNMLVTMGEFIRDHGAQLLETILNVASWVLTHLKELIYLIITFKATSTALQIAQIFTIAASNTLAGWFGGGLAAAGVLTATSLAAGSVTGSAITNSFFAEGGHVDATPGGRPVIVGEGGEGEWIIPDSKMGSMGGNSYHITIQAYSTEELTAKVKDIVSGEISASRLRSGF